MIGFGIIPQQSFLVKTVAKGFGLLMTCFFWAFEKNAARYMSHLEARVAHLEEAIGYRVWSGMPKPAYWFWGTALITPLVYAGLMIFWIYGLFFVG